MKLKPILSVSFLLASLGAQAQFGQTQQYFDGTDTNPVTAIEVQKAAAPGNLWQIGTPQKNIFSSAATGEGALVTGTKGFVPANNTSQFVMTAKVDQFGPVNILAIRWKQKLDMAKDAMGGIVEYSMDKGTTWKNIFNNPEVHNFYGYDSVANKGSLNGQTCFTGIDNNWRDIWLCFNIRGMVNPPKEILVRFTMRSEDVAANHEGWMIDNMMVHNTWVHTARTHGPRLPDMVDIYPRETKGVVNVAQLYGDVQLKKMQLYNQEGKQVAEFTPSERTQQIDMSQYPDGLYYVRVESETHTKSYKVTLAK